MPDVFLPCLNKGDDDDDDDDEAKETFLNDSAFIYLLITFFKFSLRF